MVRYNYSMQKVKIAYFGAPAFAADVLRSIIEDKDLPVEVSLVVTQPDRPVGRKQIIAPTPVKLLAQKHNIPIFDDLSLIANHPNHQSLKDIDLAFVYAYGEFIPKEMLSLPRWGFWNIHPSLLPKYRGASPIAYPLLLGDTKTGVSLIQMDERLDHGPIIDQETYEIQKSDTRELLENRLSEIGYKLFKKNIQILLDGKIQKKEQKDQDVTFTRLLTKQDGFIPYADFQKIVKNEPLTKDEIPPIISEYFAKYKIPSTFDLPAGKAGFRLLTFDLFRALSPWPGIWTLIPLKDGKKRLKITKMELRGEVPTITHVQLEGKKEVDIETFKRAY